MDDIFFEEFIGRPQGIGIRRDIEIEGAAHKMLYGIRGDELVGGSGIASHFIKNTINLSAGEAKGLLADIVGPFAVCGKGHFMSVLDKPGQRLTGGNRFVGHIDSAPYGREINIDPIRVLGFLTEEKGVLYDPGINGMLKAVRKAGTVERLVGVFGELDFGIPSRFGRVSRWSAGYDKQGNEQSRKNSCHASKLK